MGNKVGHQCDGKQQRRRRAARRVLVIARECDASSRQDLRLPTLPYFSSTAHTSYQWQVMVGNHVSHKQRSNWRKVVGGSAVQMKLDYLLAPRGHLGTAGEVDMDVDVVRASTTPEEQRLCMRAVYEHG